MKYFYDTEFLEGVSSNSSNPTIDLISIGIVSEDGREYYAISRNFDVTLAWYRNDGGNGENNFWIRENVLKTVYSDLCEIQKVDKRKQYDFAMDEFNLDNLILLVSLHGESRYVIASEVIDFVGVSEVNPIDLYGYYSAYDHVALCWLFGRMIDLPKGMPMYTKDLKQIIDEKAEMFSKIHNCEFGVALDHIKADMRYPKQSNEHNALADARWNLELYKFLK